MSIGEIFAAALKLYLDHWTLFVSIVAIVLVPYAFLTQALVVASGLTAFAPGVTPPPEAVFSSLGFLVVVVALTLLVSPFVTAAMSRAAADVYVGRRVTVGDIYRIAFSRLGAILLVLILAALLVFGGFLLLIIPGIIFAVRVAFSPVVVMLESSRGTEAVRRSWRLAKGFGWKIFGTLLLTAIISAVVGFVLSFPFARLGRAMGAGGGLLTAFGDALANVVTTPFSAIVLVLLYLDIRIRKESFDPSLPSQELVPPPPDSA